MSLGCVKSVVVCTTLLCVSNTGAHPKRNHERKQVFGLIVFIWYTHFCAVKSNVIMSVFKCRVKVGKTVHKISVQGDGATFQQLQTAVAEALHCPGTTLQLSLNKKVCENRTTLIEVQVLDHPRAYRMRSKQTATPPSTLWACAMVILCGCSTLLRS